MAKQHKYRRKKGGEKKNTHTLDEPKDCKYLLLSMLLKYRLIDARFHKAQIINK